MLERHWGFPSIAAMAVEPVVNGTYLVIEKNSQLEKRPSIHPRQAVNRPRIRYEWSSSSRTVAAGLPRIYLEISSIASTHMLSAEVASGHLSMLVSLAMMMSRH